ncbi:MAG TPA: heme A synthase [Acidimicrobiales bacterium]|nr:heme A synthase [Acidimicrobiales bacterium]
MRGWRIWRISLGRPSSPRRGPRCRWWSVGNLESGPMADPVADSVADVDTPLSTPETASPSSDPITKWLLMVAVLVFFMVLVGGFVRLSRAGLSITEWDPVTGVVPPIGHDAWVNSFAQYQKTPEFRLVNSTMTLGEYQRIFYIEWAHRLIARLAGLAVVVPLIWMMWKRRLSLRASLPYWGVAALFGVQGLIGWLMVSSGLQNRPSVSHYRLTIHLLTAGTLLALVLWMAWNRLDRDRPPRSAPPRAALMSRILLAAVVVQIAFGGLVAGLKAGLISDTWPLMNGAFLPRGALSQLTEALGAHWFHRWFAFVVASLIVATAGVILGDRRSDVSLRRAAIGLLAGVALQISLGISLVLTGVPRWSALAHQGTGVAIFVVSLFVVHATREPAPQVVAAGSATVDLDLGDTRTSAATPA